MSTSSRPAFGSIHSPPLVTPTVAFSSATLAHNPLKIAVPLSRPVVQSPVTSTPTLRYSDRTLLDPDIVLDPAASNHILELERRTMPSVANMGQQPEIRWEYRPALIDYVTSLHAQLKLCQDTLYLTVNLMDRYLSTRIVHVHMLQLLVVACTWVASKLEEEKHHIPRLDDLVYACNSAYDKLEVKRMEIEILVTLKYVLRHPNPELFIHRTALTQDEAPLTINVARYFAELTLFEADFLSYLPSTVAAAALSLARSLLGAQRTTDTDAQATACENQLRLRLSHVPPTLHAKYARSRFSEASIIVDYCVGHSGSSPSPASSIDSPYSSLPSSPFSLALSSPSAQELGSHKPYYKDNLDDFYEQFVSLSNTGSPLSVVSQERSPGALRAHHDPEMDSPDPRATAGLVDPPSHPESVQRPSQIISPPHYAPVAHYQYLYSPLFAPPTHYPLPVTHAAPAPPDSSSSVRSVSSDSTAIPSEPAGTTVYPSHTGAYEGPYPYYSESTYQQPPPFSAPLPTMSTPYFYYCHPHLPGHPCLPPPPMYTFAPVPCYPPPSLLPPPSDTTSLPAPSHPCYPMSYTVPVTFQPPPHLAYPPYPVQYGHPVGYYSNWPTSAPMSAPASVGSSAPVSSYHFAPPNSYSSVGSNCGGYQISSAPPSHPGLPQSAGRAPSHDTKSYSSYTPTPVEPFQPPTVNHPYVPPPPFSYVDPKAFAYPMHAPPSNFY